MAMKGIVYDNGRNPDIVSAYSAEAGITIATDMCEEKSNETRSVPKLLDKLDISGSIITADTMSCQKAIGCGLCHRAESKPTFPTLQL